MNLVVLFISTSARRGKAIDRVPLPPPQYGAASFNSHKPSRSSDFQPSAPSGRHEAAASAAPSASSVDDNLVRTIC